MCIGFPSVRVFLNLNFRPSPHVQLYSSIKDKKPCPALTVIGKLTFPTSGMGLGCCRSCLRARNRIAVRSACLKQLFKRRVPPSMRPRVAMLLRSNDGGNYLSLIWDNVHKTNIEQQFTAILSKTPMSFQTSWEF